MMMSTFPSATAAKVSLICLLVEAVDIIYSAGSLWAALNVLKCAGENSEVGTIPRRARFATLWMLHGWRFRSFQNQHRRFASVHRDGASHVTFASLVAFSDQGIFIDEWSLQLRLQIAVSVNGTYLCFSQCIKLDKIPSYIFNFF